MEERELVRACLRGDLEDFKGIVDKYGGPAMALAVNVLGNREDAQDACQETFIQVFRNLDRFDLERNFKTWLYTILYRKCLDQLRKRRRFRDAFARMSSQAECDSNPRAAAQKANPSPEEPPLSQNILRSLSPRERTVLCLWANEGYTAAEISQVLRCSSSTARVFLFNARKKIKTMMENKNVRL
jgi:RNA polymerase sigma-70 factor (ECF subfamily)